MKGASGPAFTGEFPHPLKWATLCRPCCCADNHARFPSCARYVSTPAFPAHNHDARAQRLAAGAAKRKAEATLVKLHKRQAALQPAAARPVPGGDQPTSAVRWLRSAVRQCSHLLDRLDMLMSPCHSDATRVHFVTLSIEAALLSCPQWDIFALHVYLPVTVLSAAGRMACRPCGVDRRQP